MSLEALLEIISGGLKIRQRPVLGAPMEQLLKAMYGDDDDDDGDLGDR
jgi:hypothetical protein